MNNPYAIVSIFFFFFSLISYSYAENHHEFWAKIQVKLPFLLLPIALANPDVISKRDFKIILRVFVGSVLLVGLISFVNYVVNYAAINETILHSKPIPILFGKDNHIYFSILLAFATWAALFLYWDRDSHHQTTETNRHAELLPENESRAGISASPDLMPRNEVSPIFNLHKRTEKTILLAAITCLLIIMHTICSRTGLVAFYAACFAAAVWFVVEKRRFFHGIIAIIIALLIAIAAVAFIPSLHNRYANTKEDLSKLTHNQNPNYYSITMRVEALKAAKNVYLNHPILGVGEGGLIDEMEAEYTRQNSILMKENRHLPHNQFVQSACTTGLAGLAIMLVFFILPFFEQNIRRNLPMLVFLVICFTAFQVESVLERQVGITFFCFFYLLLPSKTVQ